jgi:hypothetical protein
MGVIVNRALRLLRRVRDDFVALASARVDDRRIQHVRTEVGDVEYGRVGVGSVAVAVTAPSSGSGGGSMCTAAAAAAGHREGPKDRGRLCETTVCGTVADAPALHVWIEVCRHLSTYCFWFSFFWLVGRQGRRER